MTSFKALDSLVDTYNIDTVTEQYKRLEFLDKLLRYATRRDGDVIELGCASGRMTTLLKDHYANVTAVDGSSRFLEIARAQVGARCVHFIHSMFEELDLTGRFDLIVLFHVLEHVTSPVSLLSRMARFLKPTGLVAIGVPNAYALSRQLAVKMSLLESVYALTENDRRHGHQRVYDWASLERDTTDAGYRIRGRHGLQLKLFADFQNEEITKIGVIGDAQLRGLWPLADEYREIAGGIMIVCGRD